MSDVGFVREDVTLRARSLFRTLSSEVQNDDGGEAVEMQILQ